MLHALARIILNQTGLRLTSVYMMSGTDIEPPSFETEKAQRMRMLFMVEVAELGSVQLYNIPFEMDFRNESEALDVNSVPIILNSSIYRQHAWSTEADLKEFINSGLYPAEEKAQYRMMLEAFVFHKQNLAYLDTVNRQSRSAISSHGLHT